MLLSATEMRQIKELPVKAEIIGWSNKTGIEMFRYGDHIMGIQGHPEYTKGIILNLVDRLLQHNLIGNDMAITAKAKLEEAHDEPNREAWKKLCTSFLKGRL
ncbi:unnamed protein product [Cuscuta europaea]|uniref:Glutamine amidotransferase domain-containing protein n=1 Tax=Cuscuta europaea TaxID=41803 RepID=A0A9P0YI85_CUSEU|nr:unnamed protein product [Cuscuta europaea]